MPMDARFRHLLALVEVLSLDVFDTSLVRACAAPPDVFRLMEAELLRDFPDGRFAGFAQLREEVDGQARRLVWEKRQSEEVTLEELYEQLLVARPSWQPFRERLLQREMELEASLLHPIPWAQQAFREAKRQNRQVIFTSDMYLPAAFIEAQLQRHGFGGHNGLYVSSSYGKLKYQGRLFEHILQERRLQPDQLLHVGDNHRADIQGAQRLGIRTYAVSKPLEIWQAALRTPTTPPEALPDALLPGAWAVQHLHDGQASADERFWRHIGAHVAGPLLYGYVHYLIQRLRGRGLPRVYFLARDGHVLIQLYRELTAGLPDCPEAVYLYASRRALNFAAATTWSQGFEDWLAEGVGLTVGDFLARIGLDAAAYLDALARHGFTGPGHLVRGGHEYEALRRLYRDLAPEILRAAEEERTLYLAYLEQEGVLDTQAFVLIDVGWKASLQASFDRMLRPLRPDIEIEGYYLGTYPHAKSTAHERSRHQSYLLHYGEPESALKTIRLGVGLVEFFFIAAEPTFLRIRRRADGELRPELHHTHDNADDLAAAQVLQDSALQVGRILGRVGGAPGSGLSPQTVLEMLRRLLAKPSTEEAHRLGNVRYADGWGGVYSHHFMARPQGNPLLFLDKKRLKREFKSSHWPSGYVRRLSRPARLLFRLLHPKARFDRPI